MTPKDNPPAARKYKAFISYRHKPLDLEIAQKLHRRIERYVIPADLRRDGEKKLGLVFRDQDELPISSNLSDNIRQALDNSEFLIVVCSTDTPESLWCCREITYFLEHHDRSHVLAILISGDPETSFPAPLTEVRDAEGNLVELVEPLAANIVADTRAERNRLFRTESLRILASLIGCPYDALYHREQRYLMRRVFMAVGTAAVIAAVFIGMLLNRNARIREQLLSSMINESRALSELSTSAFREGNYREALETALNALPGRDPERPYVAAAEMALSSETYLYSAGLAMRYSQSFEQDTEIQRIAVSRDGTRLAAADRNGKINVSDLKSGQLLFSLKCGTQSPILYYAEDLLLVSNGEAKTVAYSGEGEELWSSEEEIILDVCEEKGLYLSCSLLSGSPQHTRVKEIRTGEIVCTLTGFDPAMYSHNRGAISPDGKTAAILSLHSLNQTSADLFLFDLSDGKGRVIRENLPFAYALLNYNLDFDNNGCLAVTCCGDDDLLKDREDWDGSFVLYFDKADNWSCRFAVNLFFGSGVRRTSGAVDLSDYMDYMECADGGIVMAGRNRMYMVNTADGSLRWQKDLPDRVRAARAYPDQKLIGMVLANGLLTFCTMDNGVLTYDLNTYCFEYPYSIYTASLTDIIDKRLDFAFIPAQSHNLVSVISFSKNNRFDYPSWSDRLPTEDVHFLLSPQETCMAAVFNDSDSNICHCYLLDPADQKPLKELQGPYIDYTEYNDFLGCAQLTDTEKLILGDFVYDFGSGRVTVLSGGGPLPETAIKRTAYSFREKDSSAVITAAVSETPIAEAGNDSSVRVTAGSTYDLEFLKNGEPAGRSTRIPLPYEKPDDVLTTYYGFSSCRCLSAGESYAFVCAQTAYDDSSLYYLYDMKEDQWTELKFLDADNPLSDGTACSPDVMAIAEEHPQTAFLDQSGELCLASLPSGEKIRSMEKTVPSESITKLLFANHDEWLLAFTRDGVLAIFDTETGRELHHSGYSGKNLRFHGTARYGIHLIPSMNRLLILYGDSAYTETAAITIDTGSMEETGFFLGLSVYFEKSEKVLLKPARSKACLGEFCSAAQMQEIAEEILRGSGY